MSGTRKKCWVPGAATKYDAEKHCKLIRDIFEKGGCIARFCASAAIGRQTFYMWSEAHPEFYEAHMKAKELSKVYWLSFVEQHAFNNEGEIQAYPLKVLLANADMSDKRNVTVRGLKGALTAAQRSKVASDLAASGEHTAEEIASVATTVRALNEMSTLEKMEQRLDALDGQSNNT